MIDWSYDDALWEAMCSGDLQTLAILCADHPEILQGEGSRDLLDAIGVCSFATIKWMIENGAPVRIDADDGFPALHMAIDRERKDRYYIVRALVAAGADVNERGINDWTPLHRAAAGRDDVQMVELLLELGADPTEETNIDHYATPEDEARHLGKHRSAAAIRTWCDAHPRSR